MNGITRQQAGFRFGVRPTKLLRVCGQLTHNGRAYKLVLLEADGNQYYAWRLYNGKGKFIKQFMFEPCLLDEMTEIQEDEAKRWCYEP